MTHRRDRTIFLDRLRCSYRWRCDAIDKVNEIVEWTNRVDRDLIYIFDLIIYIREELDDEPQEPQEPLYHIDGFPVYDCKGCPHYAPSRIDGCLAGVHNADGTCLFHLKREQFKKFITLYDKR